MNGTESIEGAEVKLIIKVGNYQDYPLNYSMTSITGPAGDNFLFSYLG